MITFYIGALDLSEHVWSYKIQQSERLSAIDSLSITLKQGKGALVLEELNLNRFADFPVYFRDSHKGKSFLVGNPYFTISKNTIIVSKKGYHFGIDIAAIGEAVQAIGVAFNAALPTFVEAAQGLYQLRRGLAELNFQFAPREDGAEDENALY